tara:strand:+ start:241 stop:570 length:330 start_codon:yes stop_codon:yes gene_type:complete
MEDILHKIGDLLSKYAVEIIGLIMGGIGSVYMTNTSNVELTKKQKFLRFASGALMGATLPTLVSKILLASFDIELGVPSVSFLGFVSGYIGVEGVTRIIIRTAEKKTKK